MAKNARGRPALGLKPTLIRFDAAVLERIDAVAGQNQRPQFIRSAVDAALARLERAKDCDG